MDLSAAIEWFKNLETDKILAYIQALDLKSVMEHPYFLSGFGVTVVICLLMRWRVFLVFLLALTGFVYLLSYTLAQGTSLEQGVPTESLVVLVVGGSFIVFLVIYFLFIRSE